MNERIKELAEQAGAVFTDVHAVSLLDDEIEKFAELIIRECAVVVFRKTGSKSALTYSMSLNVLEYFGVEE
jgi:protein tyrosine phosphatase (PTP) superfamily phosphohydrolase (DUF442 family)